uniref:Leucine-rich repeat-containing protein 23 n=2 Tax=Trichobilharzia regenti TaxID=157069 RepID=A0AA85JRD3_TRIRE|nr:unnamed protein product [Trichobilharzia regenti]
MSSSDDDDAQEGQVPDGFDEEDGENPEKAEGLNEEEVPKRPLTKEIIAECISLPYRLGYGFSHAYVKFDCSDKNLLDIELLRSYIHLRFIMMSNNFITDISPLSEIPNLMYLKADNNQITSAEPLKSLRYIEYLDLSSNKITTINNLTFLHLKHFKANDNAIATLKSENDANLSSEQFPALHTLELRGNRLVTLSGIDDMINLKTLYCAENMLRRLEGISGLKSLVRLHLRDNRITTLSGFTESLTSLEYINLRGNQVFKFSEVRHLGCLPSLKFLSLIDNPITEKDDYRQMVIGMVNKLQRLDKQRVSDKIRSVAVDFVNEHADIFEQEANEPDIIEEQNAEGMEEGKEKAEGADEEEEGEGEKDEGEEDAEPEDDDDEGDDDDDAEEEEEEEEE